MSEPVVITFPFARLEDLPAQLRLSAATGDEMELRLTAKTARSLARILEGKDLSAPQVRFVDVPSEQPMRRLCLLGCAFMIGTTSLSFVEELARLILVVL